MLNFICDPANSAVPTSATAAAPRRWDADRNAAMRKPKAPQANRSRILRAAIAEFAARGYKGASMDAIAARTQTTRALINYYFGSKQTLYLAVLEQVYSEIRTAEAQLDLDQLTPIAGIRRIVEFTFDYYIRHPGFVQIVVAENQAKGRHLKLSPVMRRLNRPIIDRLAGVIARGQAQGQFRADVDPVEVHKAIAALGFFNMTNRYTFGAIFQRDMGSKGDVARRRRIVADIVLSYLTSSDHNEPLEERPCRSTSTAGPR